MRNSLRSVFSTGFAFLSQKRFLSLNICIIIYSQKNLTMKKWNISDGHYG